MDAKYFSESRLITVKEKEQLSDILFNYYYFQYYLEIGTINIYGCECTEKEYPKMILVFVKNGKNKNFIAFPNDVYSRINSDDFKLYNRTNFNTDELNFFDLSTEKEDVILKLFGFNDN